jgi:hypothetical protein
MSELDRQGLSEEFDLEKVENQPIAPIIYEEGEDPDEIIRDNIKRANRILDFTEEELYNGNFSARLVEVLSRTMDSITNAVSQIQSTVYNQDYLQLKARVIELKEEELEYKVKNLKKPNVGSQNIIFTDRESVLKALKNNNVDELKGEEYDGQ